MYKQLFINLATGSQSNDSSYGKHAEHLNISNWTFQDIPTHFRLELSQNRTQIIVSVDGIPICTNEIKTHKTLFTIVIIRIVVLPP